MMLMRWSALRCTIRNPTSKAELKVFTVGLFGGCHPFMGVQIKAHSKLRAVINPPLLLATVAPAPGSQLLPFSAGRVEKRSCYQVCGHRCRRHSTKRIQKEGLRTVRCTFCVGPGEGGVEFAIQRKSSPRRHAQARRSCHECASARAHGGQYRYCKSIKGVGAQRLDSSLVL